MPAVDHVKLRERRDELDLSNADLAQRLGIATNYLVNILCGTNDPGPRLIHRLSRELDIPREEFDLGKRSPKGDPSEPPKQPPNEPTGPKGRPAKEPTGPPRIESVESVRSAS